jgi:hypothetical protein
VITSEIEANEIQLADGTGVAGGGMAFVTSWLYESDWELILRELQVPQL